MESGKRGGRGHSEQNEEAKRDGKRQSAKVGCWKRGNSGLAGTRLTSDTEEYSPKVLQYDFLLRGGVCSERVGWWREREGESR
jgi:hypothetical protein